MMFIIIPNIFFSLHCILLQSQKITEPIRQYKRKSVYKYKINQEQSELIEALQDQLNEFILSQRIQDAALNTHNKIRQNKRPSALKFRIK